MPNKVGPVKMKIYGIEALIPLLQDKYDTIVVSGPQRSGTTIAAQCIGKDLSLPVIDEYDFGISDFQHALSILKEGPCIAQAPALSHQIHLFHSLERTAIIWMHRSPRDVFRSELAKGWRHSNDNLQNSGHNIETRKYHDEFLIHNASIDSYYMKHDIWARYQYPLSRHNFNLSYSSLSKHPLYISPSNRNWTSLKATGMTHG